MKKYILLLLLAVISFASCENTEDNSPALQGEVDSVFFKAYASFVTEDGTGRYLIQGLSAVKTITLAVSSLSEGTYAFGLGSNNYATYEDNTGNTYTTNPLGGGLVNITATSSTGAVSGNFEFSAMIPGIDTVYVNKGKFYEVPLGVASDTDDTPNNNDGTLSAEVNSIPFNPVTISAVNTGNSIAILASTSSNSLLLRMPITVEAGDHTLPSAGFQATYTEGGNSQDAGSGTISVASHDPVARTISGSFNFVAGANQVSSGIFDVAY